MRAAIRKLAVRQLEIVEAVLMSAPLPIRAEFLPRVKRDEPMSRHTSWHIGGPADVFFTPADRTDLIAFLEVLPKGTPLFWLGLGSNLLVRDGGIRGVVIDTTGLDKLEQIATNTLYADAGVPCARIARRCIALELGPAEFFAGIPGALGGALVMNAGAFGGETWPRVRAVDVCDAQGRERRRDARDYSWSYRRLIPPVPGEYFLGAVLEFEPRPGLTEDGMRELIARRKETQPIGEWSCGSTFTNPPGNHAAKLIEGAGLKGHRIGDIMVSPKHANFLVNVGEAKASDVEKLVKFIQDEVQKRYGVRLTPEFHAVGEPL